MYLPEWIRKKLGKHCAHADCEFCPLSWEERGMEDADAGCVLYGDLDEGRPGCCLPLRIKKLLRKLIDKRNDRAFEKAHEGMQEWFERSDRMDLAMAEALAETFPELDIEPPDDRPYRLRQAYEARLAAIEPDPFAEPENERPKNPIRRLFRHGKKQ